LFLIGQYVRKKTPQSVEELKLKQRKPASGTLSR